MTFYRRIRPFLFRLDPERAHTLFLRTMQLAGTSRLGRAWLKRRFAVETPELARKVCGLRFSNPLGLAAGYDKDGRSIWGLAALGFGHLELGTVTPIPQPGNPRPRLFRLRKDLALINKMGFPNAGGMALRTRLRGGRPRDLIIGINLGKGVDTPLDRAAEDYIKLLRLFYPVADYLVINVSSPNTLGLRKLQAREYLEDLLKAIANARGEFEAEVHLKMPILVKLAPDLIESELEDAVGAVQRSGLDGIVATNTTTDRTGLHSSNQQAGGGLSGKPLMRRSTEVVKFIHTLTDGEMPIIAVGGVMGSDDVRRKLEAGASLVQLYTGLVYHGPGLVRQILSELLL